MSSVWDGFYWLSEIKNYRNYWQGRYTIKIYQRIKHRIKVGGWGGGTPTPRDKRQAS